MGPRQLAEVAPRKSRLGEKRSYTLSAEEQARARPPAECAGLTPRLTLEPLGSLAAEPLGSLAAELLLPARGRPDGGALELPDLAGLGAGLGDALGGRPRRSPDGRGSDKPKKKKASPARRQGSASPSPQKPGSATGTRAGPARRAAREVLPLKPSTAGAGGDGGGGGGAGRGRRSQPELPQRRAPEPAPKTRSRSLVSLLPWNREDGSVRRNYFKPWDGESVATKRREDKHANIIAAWWRAWRVHLDRYHFRKMVRRHEHSMDQEIHDFQRRQLHALQSNKRAHQEGARALLDEVVRQDEDLADLLEARRRQEEEAAGQLSARGIAEREARRGAEAETAAARARALRLAREAAAARQAEDVARRAREADEARALERTVRQARAESDAAADVDPVRAFLDRAADASTGLYFDAALKTSFHKTYALGPPEVSGDAGVDEGERRAEKMEHDVVLLLRSQGMLPVSTKHVLRQLKPTWAEAATPHWFRVMHGLFQAGTIMHSLDDDGSPKELWF
ncbi:hypothetical protein M885DRAFT_526003 [Pelagophyceae sp. CCMP2097]|nr:hypothetical protein M885DRAFT_526003 [Pelagophyceae sp. CCMP2097]